MQTVTFDEFTLAGSDGDSGNAAETRASILVKPPNWALQKKFVITVKVTFIIVVVVLVLVLLAGVNECKGVVDSGATTGVR